MGDNATQALWTAYDVSTMQSNTETALVVGVGLTLAFLAYKFIKRISGKM